LSNSRVWGDHPLSTYDSIVLFFTGEYKNASKSIAEYFRRLATAALLPVSFTPLDAPPRFENVI
ncbi:MAG: hypothetical protein ACFFBJ_10590, partial [Promethearchaeota archaeon]